MKIAFLRGAHLNAWELQSYETIARRHEFTAIGADWQFYVGPLPGAIQVRRPHLWGSQWAKIHDSLPVLFNRGLSWATGRSFGLDNLKSILGSPEIVHSAELYSTMTFQALEFKRRTGCRLVVTVWENLLGMGELHPWRKQRKAQVLQEADAILAVTETTRRMLIEEGVAPHRIVVIPPAVDTERFKPQERDRGLCERLGIAQTDFIILFIGRLVSEKGIAELLDTIPIILKSGAPKRIRYLFVGQGPMAKEIAIAQKRYGRVVLTAGSFGYGELPKIHNLADLFVLPSKPVRKWQEQFGYVLVESMACGKCVISTTSGSIPDVVGDAATLVAPGDASALAAKILELLEAPLVRKEFGEAALRRVGTQFSPFVVTPQLESLYAHVLSKGNNVTPDAFQN